MTWAFKTPNAEIIEFLSLKEAHVKMLRCKALCVAAAVLISTIAVAAEGSSSGGKLDDDALLDDLYFGIDGVELTPKEKQAIELAHAWRRGEILTANPVIGPDGAVEFFFGAEQPSILCAVMQVTDIELQAGESVTSVNLGDTVRWQVQPAVSSGDVTHLIVRPRDVGLDTSMVVATDRRTYHIRLRSDRTEYMPRVKFNYIEDALAKWASIRTTAKEKRERAVIPETNEYLGDLDFNYSVSGDAKWKPVRVYNDGVKTIIEMPERMRQGEAPTLLVVRKEGRVFAKTEQTMVNYRVQKNRYIVDAVFDRAILIAGVGGNQERVTVTWSPKGGTKK